jgi:ERCC4-type nuclease
MPEDPTRSQPVSTPKDRGREADSGSPTLALVVMHDHGYVLLEGDMSDFEFLTHTKMDPNSLRGFAASLMARQGMPVIPCSDTETLIDMAIRIARKHIEDPSSSSLRVKSSVESSDEPVVKRMYGCISGVGPEMAAKLHLQFPSLQDALSADVSEFETIEGVGPKTAQKIHDALHSNEIGVQETTI